jgi:hypothetical protein
LEAAGVILQSDRILLRRLPAHPNIRAERREAKKRYLLRKEMRARDAAKLAAERADATGDDIAA